VPLPWQDSPPNLLSPLPKESPKFHTGLFSQVKNTLKQTRPPKNKTPFPNFPHPLCEPLSRTRVSPLALFHLPYALHRTLSLNSHTRFIFSFSFPRFFPPLPFPDLSLPVKKLHPFVHFQRGLDPSRNRSNGFLVASDKIRPFPSKFFSRLSSPF